METHNFGKYLCSKQRYPNFFTSVFDQLLGFKYEEIIINGDFNLLLDVEKDKKVVSPDHIKKSLEVEQEYSENLD